MDVFQDAADFTYKNCHQPLSIMLCIETFISFLYFLAGNGTFFSPYFIDRNDDLFKHFTNNWAYKNTHLSNRREKLYFRNKVEEFLRGFNQAAKFIDFYSGISEYQDSVNQLINYLKFASEEFAEQFGIYFYLYGLEVTFSKILRLNFLDSQIHS